ncbi:MAG: hypothetical protein J7599_19855 [Niabella sp.]|nr:hypothetical protein [Niabella sp.]
MKHPYLILAIILMVTLLLIIDRMDLKNRRMQDGSDREDPPDRMLPEHKIANDKLIVAEGMNESNLKKMLQDFCGWYNPEMLQIVPMVTKMTDLQFVITFPYDVPFEIFCFLVNYLDYPKGYNKRFNVAGWATARSADMWVTDDLAGKQVLLFVSDFDTEYDNVFMTTADQIGYKLDFGGRRAQLLEHPVKPYQMPLFTTEDLEDKETVAVSYKAN